MKKNRRIILAAMAVAIIAVFALIPLTGQRAPPDPVYQGLKLSQWLELFDPTNRSVSPAQLEEARSIIRQMDTNALPTLLSMLRASDSGFKRWLQNAAQKQHIVHVTYLPQFNRYRRAEAGLMALGPRAEIAVPELIDIYDQNISPQSQATIARVFGSLGPSARAAVPSLLRVASSNDELTRVQAIQALGRIGPDAKPAVPMLVSVVESNWPPDGKLSNWATGPPSAFSISMDALQKIDPQTASNLVSKHSSVGK